MRRYFAEAVGTFCLVYAGTGAIVVNQASAGAITHPGIALTFGLIVLAMIYAIGDVSGAHINPAVTVAFAASGRFPWKDVSPYVIAQCLGAFCASGLLRGMFPESEGQTAPPSPAQVHSTAMNASGKMSSMSTPMAGSGPLLRNVIS